MKSVSSMAHVRGATGANRADASGRLRADRRGARGRLRTDRGLRADWPTLNGYSVLTCIWKCIKRRSNQHLLSLLSTMAGNTSSKFNNPYAYWCPDCDYKTNERVNLDIHLELNHKTTPSSTNEELIEAIEVWKIYKLLQRMKTKEVSTGFWSWFR